MIATDQLTTAPRPERPGSRAASLPLAGRRGTRPSTSDLMLDLAAGSAPAWQVFAGTLAG